MSDCKFRCPKCGASLIADEIAIGSITTCPNCSSSFPIPVPDHPEQNIKIQLGFGNSERPPMIKPSRKLVIVFITVWLVLTIISILLSVSSGFSIGNKSGVESGFNNGKHKGIKEGYTSGYKEGILSADKDSLNKAHQEGYAEGLAKGKASGLKQGMVEGQQAGRSSALAFLNDITIGSGTHAGDVRKYLGTPDRISRYETGRYSQIPNPAPCWHYGDVEIYFDADYESSCVTHWKGNLKLLLKEKLANAR
jgi:hypothetical protein